jgi:hypothetical protein
MVGILVYLGCRIWVNFSSWCCGDCISCGSRCDVNPIVDEGEERVGFLRGFGVGAEDRRTGNSKSKEEIRGFFAALRMTTILGGSLASTYRTTILDSSLASP